MLVAAVRLALAERRIRFRHALYLLAIGSPDSPERDAIIDLLVDAERRERHRVEVAQATMDLTEDRRAA